MKRYLIILTVIVAVSLIGLGIYNSHAQTKEVVEGVKDVREIMRKAAKTFEKKYAGNYVCGMDYRKVVSSGDATVQLVALKGIWASFNHSLKIPKYFWDDPNQMGCFIPVDLLCSDVCFKENGLVIPTPTTVQRTGMDGIKEFDVNFSNTVTLSSLDLKRSIELYSPLNVRQIDNFEYEFAVENDSDNEATYIISFKNKPSVFPEKTKLYSHGRITVNAVTYCPESITVYNAESRYSNHIYLESGPSFCLTPYTLKVDYSEYEGRLYTESVEKHLAWSKDGYNDGDYFNADTPPYRKPFEHRLSVEEHIFFEYPCYIENTSQWKRLFPNMAGGNSVNIYVEDINEEYWRKRIAAKTFPADFLSCDELLEQTRKNVSHWLDFLKTFMPQAEIEQKSKEYSVGRELYRLIYKCEYYEN